MTNKLTITYAGCAYVKCENGPMDGSFFCREHQQKKCHAIDCLEPVFGDKNLYCGEHSRDYLDIETNKKGKEGHCYEEGDETHNENENEDEDENEDVNNLPTNNIGIIRADAPGIPLTSMTLHAFHMEWAGQRSHSMFDYEYSIINYFRTNT